MPAARRVDVAPCTRWLREQGHGSSPRTAFTRVVSTPSAFVAVPVVPTPASDADAVPAAMQLQARLPNGVLVDLRGVEPRHIGEVIEALGRLRCSVLTKG